MIKQLQLKLSVKGIVQISITIAGIFLISFSNNANATSTTRKSNFPLVLDSTTSIAIKSILAGSLNLKFPLSVNRFYKSNRFSLAWVKPNSIKTHAWDALLLLDCANHYGLNRTDYHPADLLYETLHKLTDDWSLSNNEKARFDILLTDAMITMINNLHYGKLNPYLSPEQVDDGANVSYKANEVLTAALNDQSFTKTIESAQPQVKAYLAMQDLMRLKTGQYTGDCFEIPLEEVKMMAINMERLRWIKENKGIFMVINIPSYSLKLYLNNSIYRLKVAIGAPKSPTREIVTNFNTITISKTIHFMPWNATVPLLNQEENLKFKRGNITTNHGIEIESPNTLISTILKNTAGVKKGHIQESLVYTLPRPIPVTITYITCEVLNGTLMKYKDIYDKDKSLQSAYYHLDTQVALR